MSRRDLQNKRLDQVGRNLLKAVRASNEEIEKIVAAPQFFDSIKARIKADEQSRQKQRGFFSSRTGLIVWNRHSAAGVFALLFIVAVCAAAIFFRPQDSPQLAEKIVKPETQPPVAEIENQTPPAGIEKAKIPAIKNRVKAQRIEFKSEIPKLLNAARKPIRAKSPRSIEKQSPEIFYSLSSGGNWEANGEDLHIVRTELSRSELFALGVNLPVENESAKVKTNLLVGADGVARAIRLLE